MILCNFNCFQLRQLNSIVQCDIFKDIVAIRAGDTSVVIDWVDTDDVLNSWDVDLMGNTVADVFLDLDWKAESERLARLGSTVIDLDDEYMFEQYEAALEDAQ